MSDPYALIGLGNPGAKYVMTRHNIGFMAADAFADQQGWTWQEDGKRACWLTKGRVKDKTVFAIKPSTFMNLSGQSVLKVMNYYQIPIENILVVLDDTALPFGRVRFRKQGSAGSHNGLKSVIAELGTEEFARLRIGVSEPPEQWDLADYVLAAFTPDERTHLPKLLDITTNALSTWLTQGMEPAMNQYNPMALFPAIDPASPEADT